MTTAYLPSVLDIPTLSTAERAAILDMLFEPSIPLHTLSVAFLHENIFMSYDDLVSSIGVQLIELAESKSTSDTEWLDKILRAHPRLGDKEVDSPQSRAEQAQLRATNGKNEEDDVLKQLNDGYEEKFPGLRYVVFVNGRSRRIIMEDMRKRISHNNIHDERRLAIKAMCEIAADRARKLSAMKA